MDYKDVFYDWGGLNKELFTIVNQAGNSPTYDKMMVLASDLASQNLIVYYAMVIAFCGAVASLCAVIRNPDTSTITITRWARVVLVLFAAYGLTQLWLYPINSMFVYPRPFVALLEGEYRLIAIDIRMDQVNHSLPSPHAVFAMLLVASLWPVLGQWLRFLGICFLVWAGWSRVAMGMHFPADVVWGFALSFITVVLTRAIIDGMYYRTKRALKVGKSLQKS